MKKLYRLLFFLIGAAGVVILAVEADITRTDWNALFDEKLPLVLVTQLVLWLVICGVHVRTYQLILGPEVKGLNFRRLYKITAAGLALNSVTPAGLMGGEPYRIMELKRFCSVEKATSATLTFTIFYIAGHVVLWLTGVLLYFLFGCPGETGMTVLMALLGLGLCLACVIFMRNREQNAARSVYRFLLRIPLLKKRLDAMDESRVESLRAIDEEIRSFRREPERFCRTMLLEYTARILESLEYFIILRYLGENVSIFGAILVMSMASLIGNLIFIIPMQAGTREGGVLIALGWLCIDSSAGIRTSILYRVRDIICILFGLICILVEKKTQKE